MRRAQAGPGQRVLAQGFRRLADFPLAGQEDQNVAGAEAGQFVGGIDDCVIEIALVVLFVDVDNRAVTHLDRVEAAGHLDHRGAVEMLRETLGVDGRRGDDHLQVGPPGEQLFQVAEQKVDVQAALVRLVDDDRLVGVQIRIGLRLGEQDAIGHQLDPAFRRRFIVETDLDADAGADLRLQFLRQPRRHRTGGQPARLGMTDQAARADAEIEADFRQLRRLARSGLAAHDDYLVVGDQFGNLAPPFVDRQIGLEFGFRQACPACFDGGSRSACQGSQISLQLLLFLPGGA